jgi:hypothetical protein
MGDGPELQLRTTYFVPRLELVGQAGGGLGSRTSHSEFATEGLLGAGGRLCLDFLRPTSDGGAPTYAFNGWGGGVCYTAMYNDDGGLQQRVSAGIRPFLLDGTLMFPVDLTFVHQMIPHHDDQFGGLLNVGVRWFFARNLANGAGFNPYIGADIGLGGLGGNNFGGFYAEIQGVVGTQIRFP